MKKIKLNQPVLIPKVGSFVTGQEVLVSDVIANHVVENMRAGEIIKDISTDEVEEPPPHPTQADIIAAIAQINPDDESLWTADNKPTVEVLEDLLDKKITAEQRDEAFVVFSQE